MVASKQSMIVGGFAVFAVLTTSIVASAAPRRLKISSDGAVTDLSTTTTTSTTSTSTTSTSTSTSTTDTTLTASTSTSTSTTTDTSATATPTDGYLSTLSPTYTPGEISWTGRKWRVNAPATKYANMDHSLRRSSSWNKVRFEVRRDDPAMESNVEKRRSELSGSVYGDKTRLPNGVSLWGAFSTIHQSWADPVGMRNTWGGVYGQIHMGWPGGNPALAFRRKENGRFLITSRSEYESSSVSRYEGDLSWDVPHDIVYNVVLHPTNGLLKVWIDGKQVVNYTGGIGHSAADSYWNFGLYFSKNVTSPAVAEYANHVYPATLSLSNRIASRPAWPSN